MVSSNVRLSFIFLSTVLLGASCAFKKDGEGKEKVSVADSGAGRTYDTLSSSELKVDFVPLMEFGKYDAVLSWPEGKNLRFSIRFASDLTDKSKGFTEELVDTKNLRSISMPCISGAVGSAHITYVPAEGAMPVQIERKFVCPVDRKILKNSASVAELGGITGRLFMDGGTVLELGEQKIDLNLIELVVQGNAVIASDRPLPKNDGSDDDKAEIRIRAKKASGTLTLKLSGGNAPDARSGRELQEASAEYKELLSKNPVSNGKAGEAGQSSLSSIGRGPDRLVTTKCTKQPTNGGKGEDGKVPGMAGEDASPGGPTSRLVVAIQDVSDFQLNILNTRGKPGKAGVGGPGQRGGAGGAAGASADSCSRASEGSAGKNAPDGPSGREADFGPCGLAKLSENLLDRRILRVVSEPQGDNCINERFVESLKIDEAVSSHR